jgi:hypothetical protein
MASLRYLFVEGVPGHPVSMPGVRLGHGGVARYVGMQLDACEHDEKTGACATHPDADHVLEHYVLVREVVVDALELRIAIRHRELKLLGECVAKGFDDARVKLAALAAKHPPAPTAEPTSAAPGPAAPGPAEQTSAQPESPALNAGA